MAEITDITPDHDPVSLAREMLDRAPNATAAFAVLIGEDGTMWSDGCGHEGRDLLWALEKCRNQLMNDF